MPTTAPPRRRVLLLMGWNNHAIMVGVARMAHEADWILDASQCVTGVIPEHWTGDGILVLEGGHPEFLASLEGSLAPVVAIHDGPGIPRATCVVTQDNEAIGHTACEHLMDQGLRQTAYVLLGPGTNPIDRLRIQGMRQAAQGRAGFSVIPLPHLAEHLAALPRPIGLMAQNDYYALGILDQCISLGYVVPDDVAIIGGDNDDLPLTLAKVPLSSVDTGCMQLGYESARTLERLMAGEALPSRVVVPCGGVVVRASTTVMHIPHPATARAYQLMRDRFRHPIDLDALAGEVGMSRRRLEDRFNEYLGRSMADALLRVRLKVAKRLLAETDLKLQVIASRSGLSSDSFLVRLMRRQEGCTPNAYRKRYQKG